MAVAELSAACSDVCEALLSIGVCCASVDFDVSRFDVSPPVCDGPEYGAGLGAVPSATGVCSLLAEDDGLSGAASDVSVGKWRNFASVSIVGLK